MHIRENPQQKILFQKFIHFGGAIRPFGKVEYLLHIHLVVQPLLLCMHHAIPEFMSKQKVYSVYVLMTNHIGA